MSFLSGNSLCRANLLVRLGMLTEPRLITVPPSLAQEHPMFGFELSEEQQSIFEMAKSLDMEWTSTEVQDRFQKTGK